MNETISKSITQKVKDFVKEESLKPTSKYGFEPYEYHFKYVVKYVDELSDIYGGDKEVLEIAAWLHDIGSIIEGRENHHVTESKIARLKLEELGYPNEKIELICNCILNHRGSKDCKRETIEEMILAEADALSNFDNVSGIFKAAFVYENLDQKEAQETVKNKLIKKYKKLHFEKSKDIIKPKYEAVLTLLQNNIEE